MNPSLQSLAIVPFAIVGLAVALFVINWICERWSNRREQAILERFHVAMAKSIVPLERKPRAPASTIPSPAPWEQLSDEDLLDEHEQVTSKIVYAKGFMQAMQIKEGW